MQIETCRLQRINPREIDEFLVIERCQQYLITKTNIEAQCRKITGDNFPFQRMTRRTLRIDDEWLSVVN